MARSSRTKMTKVQPWTREKTGTEQGEILFDSLQSWVQVHYFWEDTQVLIVLSPQQEHGASLKLSSGHVIQDSLRFANSSLHQNAQVGKACPSPTVNILYTAFSTQWSLAWKECVTFGFGSNEDPRLQSDMKVMTR